MPNRVPPPYSTKIFYIKTIYIGIRYIFQYQDYSRMSANNRSPSHPGEILLKDFLEPLNLSQKQFAEHLGWTYARLNEIINKRRGVTADSALSFAESFGMEPEFWLNLQRDWDLWKAKQTHSAINSLPHIKKQNVT